MDNSTDEANVIEFENTNKEKTIRANFAAQEKTLEDIRKNLNDNTRKSIVFRNEIDSINKKIFDKSSVLMKSLTDELKMYKKDLDRGILDEDSEYEQLSYQLNNLEYDQKKIQLMIKGLTHKMKNCENEIGIIYK